VSTHAHVTTARPSSAAPTGEIKALTGLRAVAAAVVVLFHLKPFAGMYLDQLPVLRPVVAAGWTGVELFFVLSGFVLTLGYVDKVGRRPSPRVVGRFLFARVARIWPAWAAVTLVMGAWVALLRLQGGDPDVITPHPALDPGSLVGQLTMTQMWGRADLIGSSLVLPGWSISAEWSAYLAFPLLVVLLRPLRRLPAPVLLGLAMATMAPLSVTAYVTGTPDHAQPWMLRIACGFTAGMVTALAVRKVRRSPRTDSIGLAALWSSLGLVMAGAAWSWWMRGMEQGQDHDRSGVVAVVFPLLVAALCLTDRGPARWLSSGPVTYAGRLSYCLYLVHFVLIDVVVTVWWQDPADRGVVTPGLALVLPLVALLSVVASVGLHHGVEEPARRLLMRLTRPRGARSVRHAVVEPGTVTALRPRGTAARPGRTRTAAPAPLPRTSQIPVSAVRDRLLVPVGAAPVDSHAAERSA